MYSCFPTLQQNEADAPFFAFDGVCSKTAARKSTAQYIAASRIRQQLLGQTFQH